MFRGSCLSNFNEKPECEKDSRFFDASVNGTYDVCKFRQWWGGGGGMGLPSLKQDAVCNYKLYHLLFISISLLKKILSQRYFNEYERNFFIYKVCKESRI